MNQIPQDSFRPIQGVSAETKEIPPKLHSRTILPRPLPIPSSATLGLREAFKTRNFEKVMLLIGSGADTAQCNNGELSVKQMAANQLLNHTSKLSFENLSCLLFIVDVNIQDPITGNTALHKTLENRDFQKALFLIQHGADLDISGERDVKPRKMINDFKTRLPLEEKELTLSPVHEKAGRGELLRLELSALKEIIKIVSGKGDHAQKKELSPAIKKLPISGVEVSFTAEKVSKKVHFTANEYKYF